MVSWQRVDRALRRLPARSVGPAAALGVLVVATIDYATGFEASMSLLYLGPVALAAWYGRPWSAATASLLACVCAELADVLGGKTYAHPAIVAWNLLVHFGTFQAVASALGALRANLAREAYLARTDSLTGLFGHREFNDRLGQCFALARRSHAALSIAFIDLDDFKRINDTRGHAEGDRVLAALGAILGSSVRGSDTPARLGGDEFALLLPDTDALGARTLVGKLLARIDMERRQREGLPTCSVGVVTVISPAVSMHDALRAADGLMYEVKRSGKGGVAYRTLGAT